MFSKEQIEQYRADSNFIKLLPETIRTLCDMALKSLSPEGWIACSERLPGEGADVLAWCGWSITASYKNPKRRMKAHDWHTEDWHNPIFHVTHWMPLPRPPAPVSLPDGSAPDGLVKKLEVLSPEGARNEVLEEACGGNVVNAAGISASDLPHVVVEKYRVAIRKLKR